jgi:ubiquinone biosynthesis protein COQ9
MPTGTDQERGDAARRRAILAAALPHVPFDGWSRAALEAGGRDAGFDATETLRAFPGGALEAIRFWSVDADRAMLEALAAQDLTGLRVRERIAAAIRARLHAVAPHREALRRAIGVMALPQNAPRAAELTWRTVDAIWWAAGDTATDWNFYTKRALLAGVYGATLLRFLEDRSDGSADTWAFLDRRIADALRLPQALGRVGAALPKLPDPLALLRGLRGARPRG